MLTMLLGGLWHGASWTFVIWGGLHGGALAVERFWADYAPKSWPPLPVWARLLLTFHVVLLGWIFFRAASFDDAMAYLAGMLDPFDGPAGLTASPLIVLLIGFGLAIHAMPTRWMAGAAIRIRTFPAPLVGVGLAALILVIDAMRFEGVAPFIYYRF
jgi:hypothetical protein